MDGEGNGAQVDNFSELLIECVRRIPGLWDKRSKDFVRKNSHKDQSWAKVAEECGSDVKTVKERWRHLRDYYMARRRKQPPSGSAAEAAPGRRQGRYAQLLSFLSPIAQRGSTTSSAVFPAGTRENAPAPAPNPGTSDPVLTYVQRAAEGETEGSGDIDTNEYVFADGSQFLEVELETEQTYETYTQQTPQTQHPHQHQNTRHAQHTTPNTEQAPHTETQQDTDRARQAQSARITQQTTQNTDSTPTSHNSSQRLPKRKAPDVDKAIMDELARGRERETDRVHTFCNNLYAELKHRSEATQKVIKRKILDLPDEHED